MGLLDDAIREHLELKRRHGADPREVARQEDEALGPIGGREPQRGSADADDRAAAHAPHSTDLYDDEAPVPYEEPAAPAHADRDALELSHVAEEPAEEPAEPAGEAPADARQQTTEYSIVDEPILEPEPKREVPPEPARAGEPPAPAGADEPAAPADELEETPEFLQETPEHDRLWFEQKPPRDFDF